MDFNTALLLTTGCNLILITSHENKNKSISKSKLFDIQLEFLHSNYVNINLFQVENVLGNKNQASTPKRRRNCSLVFLLLLSIHQGIRGVLHLNKFLTQSTVYFIEMGVIEPFKNVNELRQSIKNDPRFQKAHPHLIFINKFSWTPVCYLCPYLDELGQWKIYKSTIFSHKTLPKISEIPLFLTQLNSNAWGAPAFVSAVLDNDTDFIRGLETKMKQDWRVVYTVKVLLGILSQKLCK